MKLLELADPFEKNNLNFVKNLIKLVLMLLGSLILFNILTHMLMIDLGNDLPMLIFGFTMCMLGLYLGMCVQLSRQKEKDGERKLVFYDTVKCRVCSKTVKECLCYPLPCPFCSAEFGYAQDWNHHLRENHKDRLEEYKI